jgi:hypothetical protein
MNKSISQKIENAINLLKTSDIPESIGGFVPDIIEVLKEMRDADQLASAEKSQLVGALFKLVTEDYEFAQTTLAKNVLEVGDEFLDAAERESDS